jgi:hypothetical protein
MQVHTPPDTPLSSAAFGKIKEEKYSSSALGL